MLLICLWFYKKNKYIIWKLTKTPIWESQETCQCFSVNSPHIIKMNYLVLLLTICTVLSVKKPPDLDPPNSSTTARSTTTTIKSTSKNPTTTPTKSTSKSPPSTTTKSTTKKPPTTSTWDPPTTTVIYDEPGDCDFETECQWRLSTTGRGAFKRDN